MKELNYKFIISNIITAIVLFFSVPYYKSNFPQFHRYAGAPAYGYTIIALVALGMVATMLKAYNIAQKSRNKIQWHGQLFLVVLYISSFVANLFLLNAALRMIGFSLREHKGAIFCFCLALLIGFISLALECHYLQHRPKKPLPATWEKRINIASAIYSGLGISLCWNHFVAAGAIHFSNNLLAILAHIALMLVLVFPFQRLFWYEIIADSESHIDNLKTFGAISLVFLSGILPIFLAG